MFILYLANLTIQAAHLLECLYSCETFNQSLTTYPEIVVVNCKVNFTFQMFRGSRKRCYDKVWAKVRRDLSKSPQKPKATVSVDSSSESDNETVSIPLQNIVVDEYEAKEMEPIEDVLTQRKLKMWNS